MRKIEEILQDMIQKATPLSPYPDGYKNYLVGQEFIYEIQEYLKTIEKKEENKRQFILRKRRVEMFRKIFYKIWHFLAMMQVAFVMIFKRPIRQIHNEERETDKERFARIPIGIYPLQYFVTQFQMIHDVQKMHQEVLQNIVDAIKSQNEAVLTTLKIFTEPKIKKDLDEIEK